MGRMIRRRPLLAIAALVAGMVTVLTPTASAAVPAGAVGDVTGFTGGNGDYVVSAGDARLRLKFYDDDVFRAWLVLCP
jgi:alpha-glucosidase